MPRKHRSASKLFQAAAAPATAEDQVAKKPAGARAEDDSARAKDVAPKLDSPIMNQINVLMSRVLAEERSPTELEFAKFTDLVRAELSDEHGVESTVTPEWVHMASMRFHKFADDPPPWLTLDHKDKKGKKLVAAVGIDLSKRADGTVDLGPDGNSVVLFKADPGLEMGGKPIGKMELLHRLDRAPNIHGLHPRIPQTTSNRS